MPLYLSPRFAVPEDAIFHAVLLANTNKDASSPELIVETDSIADFRVNPEVDFRVTLAFASHKLQLPWITVFDAAQRRSLQKLEVVFLHDAYEVVKVDFQSTCKSQHVYLHYLIVSDQPLTITFIL
jgi:hypothetical protein